LQAACSFMHANILIYAYFYYKAGLNTSNNLKFKTEDIPKQFNGGI